MGKAKSGDSVKVHYIGKLEDGTVFDSSRDRDPLEFKLGEGQVIRGIEEAVLGMDEGERKTAKVPFEKAYGPHQEDKVMHIDRGKLPPHLEPQAGQRLQVRKPGGITTSATVTEVSESHVKLDANHPLAGKDLTFDIELVKII